MLQYKFIFLSAVLFSAARKKLHPDVLLYNVERGKM